MQIDKTEVVVGAINALRDGGEYDRPEVQAERVEAVEKLKTLQADLDSIAFEADAALCLMLLSKKFAGMNETAKAEEIEKMAFLIFNDGETEPWYTKEPEREPDCDPSHDVEGMSGENEARLSEVPKSALNGGEMPTIVISRRDVNVLCISKRNDPDEGAALPIAWHQPITGKAVIEVVGVQVGEVPLPLEIFVVFKGKRSKLHYTGTGLSGTVHVLVIDPPDTDNGRFNRWDLYTDVPTDKGKVHGIAEAPKRRV